jgi:ubiquinone/menaquinone biosynthesis C-methylase UbiE
MNKFLFEPPRFLDPEKTLFAAGLSAGQTLADLGAGSGFYVMAAGKIVGERGAVYAVDILETALDHIAAQARLQGLRNVKSLHADLEQSGTLADIPTGSLDCVLLANILHQIKNRQQLLAESYRVLKTGGKLIALEWNDEASPIGPQISDRVPAKVMKTLATACAFKEAGELPVDHYHYGLMFIK